MPLKLTVGVSRKVGQPNYGSLGASCALELELAEALLRDHPEEFRDRVRGAFDACARSVREELERHEALAREANGHPVHDVSDNGARRDTDGGPRSRRPCTAAQVRALWKLAHRQGRDLEGVVGERFGVDGPEDLSVAEASRLIEELQHAPADAMA